jgi:hypothetical protein
MDVHVGHDVCEILKDCCLTAEQISRFYGKTVRVIDFFAFLDFSTFQTFTVLFTVMTQTVTEYGN